MLVLITYLFLVELIDYLINYYYQIKKHYYDDHIITYELNISHFIDYIKKTKTYIYEQNLSFMYIITMITPFISIYTLDNHMLMILCYVMIFDTIINMFYYIYSHKIIQINIKLFYYISLIFHFYGHNDYILKFILFNLYFMNCYLV
jgi:hypothetical protein